MFFSSHILKKITESIMLGCVGIEDSIENKLSLERF